MRKLMLIMVLIFVVQPLFAIEEMTDLDIVKRNQATLRWVLAILIDRVGRVLITVSRQNITSELKEEIFNALTIMAQLLEVLQVRIDDKASPTQSGSISRQLVPSARGGTEH